MKKNFILIMCIIAISILLSKVENAFSQSGQKYSVNGNNLQTGDFLGSNNDVDLVFKRFGVEFLRSKNGILEINSGNNLKVTGSIQSNTLSGSYGLVQYDMTGKLLQIPFGNPSSVLFGDGTWGLLPPDDDWLTNSVS